MAARQTGSTEFVLLLLPRSRRGGAIIADAGDSRRVGKPGQPAAADRPLTTLPRAPLRRGCARSAGSGRRRSYGQRTSSLRTSSRMVGCPAYLSPAGKYPASGRGTRCSAPQRRRGGPAFEAQHAFLGGRCVPRELNARCRLQHCGSGGERAEALPWRRRLSHSLCRVSCHLPRAQSMWGQGRAMRDAGLVRLLAVYFGLLWRGVVHRLPSCGKPRSKNTGKCGCPARPLCKRCACAMRALCGVALPFSCQRQPRSEPLDGAQGTRSARCTSAQRERTRQDAAVGLHHGLVLLIFAVPVVVVGRDLVEAGAPAARVITVRGDGAACEEAKTASTPGCASPLRGTPGGRAAGCIKDRGNFKRVPYAGASGGARHSRHSVAEGCGTWRHGRHPCTRAANALRLAP